MLVDVLPEKMVTVAVLSEIVGPCFRVGLRETVSATLPANPLVLVMLSVLIAEEGVEIVSDAGLEDTAKVAGRRVAPCGLIRSRGGHGPLHAFDGGVSVTRIVSKSQLAPVWTPVTL